MNDQTDSQLLRAYAEHRAEPAFAELIRRHVDFVYSAAQRLVCDSHLAEDVTQGVFVALAKQAVQLADRPLLSAWLHCTARNIAAQTVRTDVRRRAREQEAVAMNEFIDGGSETGWEEIAPHLDAALGELVESDRDALLLRYFERKSAQEIAQTLGISDEAAQKRVSRAVEKLRELFFKRKITIGASGLAVLISTNAVQSAPIGLVATISAAAVLAGTVVHTSTIIAATKTIAMTTFQKALVTVALTAAVGTGIFEAHQVSELREQNQKLQQQQTMLTEQVQQLHRERDAATNRFASLFDRIGNLKGNSTEIKSNTAELLKLRGQIGVLRRQSDELAQVVQSETQAHEATKLSAQTRIHAAQMMAMAHFFMDGDNIVLTNLDQLMTLPPPLPEGLDVNKFELVSNPVPVNIRWPEVIVFRERIPRQTTDGKWARVYGRADGMAVEQISEDGNFEAWEKEHLMPPQNGP